MLDRSSSSLAFGARLPPLPARAVAGSSARLINATGPCRPLEKPGDRGDCRSRSRGSEQPPLLQEHGGKSVPEVSGDPPAIKPRFIYTAHLVFASASSSGRAWHRPNSPDLVSKTRLRAVGSVSAVDAAAGQVGPDTGHCPYRRTPAPSRPRCSTGRTAQSACGPAPLPPFIFAVRRRHVGSGSDVGSGSGAHQMRTRGRHVPRVLPPARRWG